MARRLVFFALLVAGANSAPATLSVGAQPVHRISPVLYSLFLETEINFGGEGGLYAELVWNRDFEALGRGQLGTEKKDAITPGNATLDPHEPAAIPTDFRPWSAVGGASLSVDDSEALFVTNPHSLKVVASAGGGASNPGYFGIGVRSDGPGFRLSLYAKGAPRLIARLVVNKTVLCESPLKPIDSHGNPVKAEGWQQLAAELRTAPGISAPAASLEVLVAKDAVSGASTFWLDSVSLMPADAVAGLFRKDLFEKLKDMRPGFVRTPGGNYLEGYGPRTRWDWKQTLGHRAERPGHYNSAWGYWVTDGLGLYELLLLSELLESEALMSIFTGYSMGAPYVPLEQSQAFAQDALDLLEFANGENDTKFGALRVAMGHEAPFNLRRVEVGNEEMDMPGYASHYELIVGQLRAKHPHLVVVASGRWGPSVDGSPCLTGQRCDVWDDHYYRTPDEMVALAHAYDNYSRSWPKVFVGEYAACGDRGGRGSLRAGIAEASFLVGFERNADVVVASAFAPLFSHVEGASWSYNLIKFNATAAFALPGYYVQRMFSGALGAGTLDANMTGDGPGSWIAAASVTEDGVVVVKVSNYGSEPRDLAISLQEWAPKVPVEAAGSLLTADSPDAENTLDEPEAVVPKRLVADITGSSVHVLLPPWSAAVVQVKMGSVQTVALV